MRVNKSKKNEVNVNSRPKTEPVLSHTVRITSCGLAVEIVPSGTTQKRIEKPQTGYQRLPVEPASKEEKTGYPHFFAA
jgi:hypothetical protein